MSSRIASRLAWSTWALAKLLLASGRTLFALTCGLRERLQRLANRLVYGASATPYEVMVDFARRLAGAASTDELLPRMAEATARGVGAERGRVRVMLPGGRERSAGWPAAASEGTFDRTVPVVHHGLVGEIAVAKAAGERLTPQEEKLLVDLASQAGLGLRNVGLMAELEDRLNQISVQTRELEASRRRIVAAQDVERRRLERDLHDGAQQQLVSLAGQLRFLKRVLAHDPDAAEPLLDKLVVECDEALENVRDLARGIFPQVLGDRGLSAAVSAWISKHFPQARLECGGELASARFDSRVEAAVYFGCLEALQNAARHAGGAPVSVELTRADGVLEFRVTDHGPGFDQSSISSGTGLQNMADRLAALGGALEVRSRLGRGTTVTGRAPLDEAVVAQRTALP